MSDSEAAEQAVVLRYAAKDDAYFMGVPARDLTDNDVSLVARSGRFGKTKPTVIKFLVESGMYDEPANAARKSAAPAADREAN